MAFVILLRKDNGAESLLTTLPTLSRELLHVCGLVVLVDDLKTEDRLDDVLKGDYALETTIFINDETDLLVLLEQFLPDVTAGVLLCEERDRTFQFHKTLVELIICQSLKCVTQKNIAGDIFRRIPIDRDSGEMQISIVL